MILRDAICILVGGALGACMRMLTLRMIHSRTGQEAAGMLMTGRWSIVLWIAVGAAGCGAIALLKTDLVFCVEISLSFLVLMSLSAVDSLIRKIPNELLLALVGIKLIAIVVSGHFSALLPALVGLAVGLIVFLIPSRMGVNIGIGDVKLAAVTGFYLGLVGLIQSVMIMGAVLGMYALYLLVTKRGNLKSKVAMGPALSLGMLATLLFPLAIFL